MAIPKGAKVALAVGAGYVVLGVLVEVARALRDRKVYSNTDIGPTTYVSPYNVLRWPGDVPTLWGGEQISLFNG